MNPKRKPKSLNPRELLVSAYHVYADRRAASLSNIDPEVARRAIEVLVDPEKAAVWLLTTLKELERAPIMCPPESVLDVLGRLEHGVFA
jgi:uncharacterized protein (DUF2384 family)